MGDTATRRSMLLALAALPLAGCAGVLRSPADDQEAERPVEGGIGGTGIVGMLTERDTLSVNGLALAAAEDLIVRDAYGGVPAERLQLGQALTVEAATDEGGMLRAKAVSIVHPLIGKIDSAENGRLSVMGTEVLVERGAALVGMDGRRFRPKAGQRVAVSGLWRGPEVVASRLDLLGEDEKPDVVAGVVKTGPAPDRPTLAGLELTLPPGTEMPAVGTFVTALGRRAEDHFRVESLRSGRFLGAAGPLTRLSVEGYLEPIPRPPGYVVADLGHSFDQHAKLSRFAKERALYLGPYEGAFVVDLALPLPEDLGARRRLLTSLPDAFDPPGALSTR